MKKIICLVITVTVVGIICLCGGPYAESTAIISSLQRPVNCNPKYIYWEIGPNETTDSVDVCYAVMDITDIIDDFDFVAFEGNEKAFDRNADGISGSGVKKGNIIRWLGSNCKSFVNVTTKNCNANPFQGDCIWVGIRLKPKANRNNGSFQTAPVMYIQYRSSTGVLFDHSKKRFLIDGYAYSNCCSISADQ